MEDIRWKQRFGHYEQALQQLTLAVALLQQRPLSDLEKQGVIQCFEFTCELAWKVLSDYLEHEGIQGLAGARRTVREAFKRGLISEGEVWMDMIEKRNLATDSYNLEITAQLLNALVEAYLPAFTALQAHLEGAC